MYKFNPSDKVTIYWGNGYGGDSSDYIVPPVPMKSLGLSPISVADGCVGIRCNDDGEGNLEDSPAIQSVSVNGEKVWEREIKLRANDRIIIERDGKNGEEAKVIQSLFDHVFYILFKEGLMSQKIVSKNGLYITPQEIDKTHFAMKFVREAI